MPRREVRGSSGRSSGRRGRSRSPDMGHSGSAGESESRSPSVEPTRAVRGRSPPSAVVVRRSPPAHERPRSLTSALRPIATRPRSTSCRKCGDRLLPDQRRYFGQAVHYGCGLGHKAESRMKTCDTEVMCRNSLSTTQWQITIPRTIFN